MKGELLGSTLHVDLATHLVRRQPFTADLAEAYLGGRGYNARLLWDLAEPGTDPLGPGNPLVFGVGPLTGTSVPASGRATVTARSPATGFYVKANVGGHWGGELKYAGYSHLVFTGCAERPVYLWLDDDKAEIRDAGHLWGKDVVETTRLIRQELGDPEVKVACIGPGGENLVVFAAVMVSDYNAAARGGVGAVMGSKRLKAIAVRGTKALEAADPKAFDEALKEIWEALMTGPRRDGLHLYGTSGGIAAWNELQLFPGYNFQTSSFEQADKLSGQRLVEEGYLKRRVACFACPTGCHRYSEIGTGRYAGAFTGGPEYETMGSLGAGCGVSDLEPVIKANELCNRYGLDTISTGSVIQWLMECHERGLDFDREGLDLSWGAGDSVVALVERIALRQGIGGLLAKGVRRAALEMGQDSRRWAVEAKGLEQSRVDTRSTNSYALSFAVNPRGPDHLTVMSSTEFGFSPQSIKMIETITGDAQLANPRRMEKRGEIVRWHEDAYAIIDSLGLCFFGAMGRHFKDPQTVQRTAALLWAATGRHFDGPGLLKAGRRIVTLEKCYNVREGATRGDDRLPWRLMNEEPRNRPGEGAINSLEKLNALLDQYYTLHGWDRATSWPTRETLVSLDLADVADELGQMGKLPPGPQESEVAR